MPKKPNQTASGTSIQKVKQANQAAENGTYETEFADETDAQKVKEQIQKSKQNKK